MLPGPRFLECTFDCQLTLLFFSVFCCQCEMKRGERVIIWGSFQGYVSFFDSCSLWGRQQLCSFSYFLAALGTLRRLGLCSVLGV